MYGEIEFSADVIEKFGDLIHGLSEEPEMLHTQMGYLADGIREKPSCANAILSFIEGLLQRNDAILEIENAIAISFMEIEELQNLGLQAGIPPLIYQVLKDQQQMMAHAKNT